MHAVYPVSSENLVNRFWQMKLFHSEFINLLLLVIPLEFQHLCVPFDYRADTVKKKTKTLNANFPPHKSHFTWRAAREDMNCPGCTLVSGQSFYTDLGRLNSFMAFLTTIRADGGRKEPVLFSVLLPLLLSAYSHQFSFSWKRPHRNKSFA